MKKLLPFCIVLVGLVSCKNGSGHLNVDESLVLKGKKGKEVKFEPGVYGVELNFKKKLFSSKKTIVMEARGKDKVIVKIPKKVKVPSNFGTLSLKSHETGQPVDILATIDTHYDSSAPQRGFESCTERREYRECFITEAGERAYRVESMTLSGDREIVFHYESESKKIDFELTSPETGDVLATFEGSDDSSRRIVDRRMRCKLDRRDVERFRRIAQRAKVCPRPNHRH